MEVLSDLFSRMDLKQLVCEPAAGPDVPSLTHLLCQRQTSAGLGEGETHIQTDVPRNPLRIPGEIQGFSFSGLKINKYDTPPTRWR